jgi:intracellular sulfur oxidation DsrE/DsrF family protein
MVFLNSAVKLLAEGTGSAATIHSLGAAGTRLLACSNSLDYYEMNAKLAVGKRAEMSEIVETLSRASKVISI